MYVPLWLAKARTARRRGFSDCSDPFCNNKLWGKQGDWLRYWGSTCVVFLPFLWIWSDSEGNHRLHVSTWTVSDFRGHHSKRKHTHVHPSTSATPPFSLFVLRALLGWIILLSIIIRVKGYPPSLFRLLLHDSRIIEDQETYWFMRGRWLLCFTGLARVHLRFYSVNLIGNTIQVSFFLKPKQWGHIYIRI